MGWNKICDKGEEKDKVWLEKNGIGSCKNFHWNI